MQELDIFQRQAVLSTHRNTVVTAPPGSGKTRVIVERVKCVLDRSPEKPNTTFARDTSDIVVITYTNAAANELRERLPAEYLEQLAYVGTIHGFAKWLIEQWFVLGGGSVSVMDEEEDFEQLQATATKLNLKLTQTAIRQIARRTDEPKQGVLTDSGELLYRAHCKWQAENSRYSFAGLLRTARIGLRAIATIEFDLIVDEYQDASASTHELLEALPTRSRFYVGDANQSIFGFIGGSPERLLELACRSKTDPSNWVHIELQNTYRCSQRIVDAANKVVERLPSRTVMAARSQRADQEVRLREYRTTAEENVEIAREILSGVETREEGETFAVICRTNAQCEEMRSVLESMGLKVKEKIRREKLPGVKQALVILDYIANRYAPGRAEAVNRLIMTPADFNARQMMALRDCRAMGGPPIVTGYGLTYAISEIASNIKEPDQKIDQRTMVAIGAAEHALGSNAKASDLALVIRSPDFELAEDEDESDEASVTVTTVHGAKGLEWAHVWIIGCSECYWKGSPDEERRLFYVALTRAKDYASASWSRLSARWAKGRVLEPVQSDPIPTVRELLAEEHRLLPRTRRVMPPELQTSAMNELEIRTDLEEQRSDLEDDRI